MRAVTIERFGDPSGMAMTDVPVPTPGPGQLVIETEAIGVGGQHRHPGRRAGGTRWCERRRGDDVIAPARQPAS